jgi:hypothetical protein
MLGFFICQKYFCNNDKALFVEVKPKYQSIDKLFKIYQNRLADSTNNFNGFLFTSDDLKEIADSFKTTTNIGMLIGVDEQRNKVAYFKAINSSSSVKSENDSLVFYLVENNLSKSSKRELQLFTLNNSSVADDGTLKSIFEYVFTNATAAKLPTCPPYDLRCTKTQASLIVGTNTAPTGSIISTE